MTTPTPHRKGIILFAHGSRDPLWHQPIQAVAQQIKNNDPEALVECAYLELSTPDIATACGVLLDAGVQHISIIPLFFGVGRHAREDLPVLVHELRDKHPDIEFALQPAVGENPRLIQLLATLAQESVATATP
jgi:sirohydrochlorin cobaltochelatase